MNSALDVATSTLASTVSLWRGLNGHPTKKLPEIPLELYDMEGCPYCRLVREVLTELDLDAMIYPCPKGGQRFRPKVVQAGGRAQFPYLVDRNTHTSMYESTDIIDYLYKTYADMPVPAKWRRAIALPTSFVTSGVRMQAGIKLRPNKPAAKPMELFSFESSPYSRRVRELMTELEIPYLLRNTGKAMLQDMGPPQVRKTLFPNLPVKGRNRLALLERTGRVQVPYLVDTNTGNEMYESDAIRAYLLANYAA